MNIHILLHLFLEFSVPVLLFESVFSTSEWCFEEHGFSKIFYLHSGEEKVWYVVPQECTKQFLPLKREFRNFVTADELISKGCQLTRCVQKAGQYVVILPNCYYCSVATGYAISEVVSVAHINWFTSRNFLSFKPKLNEFVITKMILSCSMEERKKETRSCFCQFLIQKLDVIAKIIYANIKRLNASGIHIFSCLRLKEASPLTCPKCNCICYLIRVKVKSKNSSFCVDDALKMIHSKLKAEEFIIELIFTVEKIQSLIGKLKNPLKKKRR